MPRWIVVDDPREWPLEIPKAEVISARDYLSLPETYSTRRAKVFNLCRSYRYQSLGYYVSLLAAARGHRPLPAITTILGLRDRPTLRILAEDLEEEMSRALSPLRSDRFTLSIYFGRNLARRYDRLCRAIFNYMPAPLMRAEMVRAAGEEGEWKLSSLRLISAGEIPEHHRPFVVEQASRFFARPTVKTPKVARYDLAILANPEEEDPPSSERALARFVKAARKLGIAAWILGPEDIGRIGEYDALFLRETTSVEHHTYRFALRAKAEGLVVIDDPESIVRCANKVYQAELFERHKIPCPKTLVLHSKNAHTAGATLGYPCVLKSPDSAFSKGVHKADNEEELRQRIDALLKTSDLIVAQQFMPSDYDYRIGVLDGEPLFAARYYMAKGHWQIQRAGPSKRGRYGKVEALPIAETPKEALRTAIRAASLIGDGLYGVDLKEHKGRFYVMEINDNPNIEAGEEDAILGKELYLTVMRSFLRRLERRGKEERRGIEERREPEVPQ